MSVVVFPLVRHWIVSRIQTHSDDDDKIVGMHWAHSLTHSLTHKDPSLSLFLSLFSSLPLSLSIETPGPHDSQQVQQAVAAHVH